MRDILLMAVQAAFFGLICVVAYVASACAQRLRRYADGGAITLESRTGNDLSGDGDMARRASGTAGIAPASAATPPFSVSWCAALPATARGESPGLADRPGYGRDLLRFPRRTTASSISNDRGFMSFQSWLEGPACLRAKARKTPLICRPGAAPGPSMEARRGDIRKVESPSARTEKAVARDSRAAYWKRRYTASPDASSPARGRK